MTSTQWSWCGCAVETWVSTPALWATLMAVTSATFNWSSQVGDINFQILAMYLNMQIDIIHLDYYCFTVSPPRTHTPPPLPPTISLPQTHFSTLLHMRETLNLVWKFWTTSWQHLLIYSAAPPVFESIMEDLDVCVGDTTRFAVVVDGKPDPDILWYKVSSWTVLKTFPHSVSWQWEPYVPWTYYVHSNYDLV